ncbi:MAG: tetratricopeptide repeat protein, partial [Candidatus Rokuibacteriota bacterium]
FWPEAGVLLRPAGGGASVAGTIASLQDRLRAVPEDWRGFAQLGLAYVQEARITADPGSYPKAEGVLRRSLELNGRDNFEALVGMGALALARHDFEAALAWGKRALAENPYNADVYGVIGDAQLELGRYAYAFATFQATVDTRPDLASYARVSYARELRGDVRGAIVAMEAAVEAAGTPEDAAWARYQLGELYFNTGRFDRAEAAYRGGVELAPDFVPPHAGLAKVGWAQGNLERAIRGYSWVVRRFPAPEHVIALGDLYASNGQDTLAERQYALVRAEEELFRANGVNVDLELALFDADHGYPGEALAAARAEWWRRHSIHVADALAWALYANGRYEDAVRYADRALSLGMRNALFMFHAGMIRLRLGDEEGARALLRDAMATNPNFSILYAPVAERTLAELEGRS